MAYPTKIYIYQEDNNPSNPWKFTFSKDSIPPEIKIGIYVFDRKARVEVVISEDETLEV